MTEEEVAEAATTAAQEAANNSYVLQSASQHGTDAQSRYYALAHRLPPACDLRAASTEIVLPTVMLTDASHAAQPQPAAPHCCREALQCS